jgi:hypothetical protein
MNSIQKARTKNAFALLQRVRAPLDARVGESVDRAYDAVVAALGGGARAMGALYGACAAQRNLHVLNRRLPVASTLRKPALA